MEEILDSTGIENRIAVISNFLRCTTQQPWRAGSAYLFIMTGEGNVVCSIASVGNKHYSSLISLLLVVSVLLSFVFLRRRI